MQAPEKADVAVVKVASAGPDAVPAPVGAFAKDVAVKPVNAESTDTTAIAGQTFSSCFCCGNSLCLCHSVLTHAWQNYPGPFSWLRLPQSVVRWTYALAGGGGFVACQARWQQGSDVQLMEYLSKLLC